MLRRCAMRISFDISPRDQRVALELLRGKLFYYKRIYQEWKGELIEGKIYFPTVSISIDFGREEGRDDEMERVYRARAEVGQ